MLAVGATAVGYAAGKGARTIYDMSGTEIDLVSGSGISKICK